MKRTPTAIGLLLALILVPIGPVTPAFVPAGSAAAGYQLLTNPSMESYDPPYGQYDLPDDQFEGVDLQVATGWQRFWYGGPEPYWMDCRDFADSYLGDDWVEAIDGHTSQMIFSTEPYTAGLQQQVTGLTPGLGYGFHAAMQTIFQTSDQPPIHGTMLKQVGIDPTGGTDPQAPAVVWSEPADQDRGWIVDLRFSVWAQAPTMTVFIRVTSPYVSGDPSFLNQSFLDSAILARTPTIAAVSPAVSDEPTFTVSWENAVPAPGANRLKQRDVQWFDEAEGVWHDWLIDTGPDSASFTGERGHAYRFRARVAQEYQNGALLYSPYRPEGDTRTWVRGPVLAGQVLSHDGLPLGGATVALVGTPYSTLSRAGGWFDLPIISWSDPYTATVAHPYLPSPSPLYDITCGPTETVPFTWTLRPRDDAVVNGEFEMGLAGWHAAGIAPSVIAGPVHTGHGALALGGAADKSFTSGVTQTLTISRSWEPALSFWYNPVETESGDRFNLVMTVVTQTVSLPAAVTATHVLTPTLDSPGWTHVAYPFGLPDAYFTGTVTLRFQVWHTSPGTDALYLDEVSLGATFGGPYKVCLPIVLKSF